MVRINKELAQNLVNEQCPQFRNLKITDVELSGWDNKIFRLGSNKLIRIPTSKKYEAQIEKEAHFLPIFSKILPFEIPKPIFKGDKGSVYELKWAIYNWIEGEVAFLSKDIDYIKFIDDLATFLKSLHNISPEEGPVPGMHNFHRGGDLKIYDKETKNNISFLKGKIDDIRAMEIWNNAISTKYLGKPVWVHGDISLGNILVSKKRIKAIIDFGMMAVGDPACDLAAAYNLFNISQRDLFISKMDIEGDIWDRAKGWALWKNLLTYAHPNKSNLVEKNRAYIVLQELGLFD